MRGLLRRADSLDGLFWEKFTCPPSDRERMVLDRIRDLLGNSADEERDRYRCINCGEEFERPFRECPDCGGQFVAPVEGDSHNT